MTKNNLSHNQGFTLLEILLVIAIIVILATLTIPFYQSFQLSSRLSNVTQETVQSLRRAQARSIANESDSVWSCNIGDDNKITVFLGSDYVSRDNTYDETFDLPTNITVSGTINEVTFDRLTGKTTDTGTITLTNDLGETVDIFVNSEGIVNY